MGVSLKGPRMCPVIIDLNTQVDFLSADGALPVRNREALVTTLRRLLQCIRHSRWPLISSIESHHPDDTMHGTPLHCVDGTNGQDKPRFTLLSPRIMVEATNNFDLPHQLMGRYRQVIFRKHDHDLFANPKADRLLTELNPSEYILFGIAAERSVKAVALGLLARHKRVAVITDACGYWNEAEADFCIRQIAAKGVRLTTVRELSELAATASKRRALRRQRSQRPQFVDDHLDVSRRHKRSSAIS